MLPQLIEKEVSYCPVKKRRVGVGGTAAGEQGGAGAGALIRQVSGRELGNWNSDGLLNLTARPGDTMRSNEVTSRNLLKQSYQWLWGSGTWDRQGL